jgi:hypothetical protein
MRPNLALGPIDSVAQYLLYVSIVVLGVLLPILVQKWRQRRQDAALVRRTLDALAEENRSNRSKLAKSRASFAELARLFEEQYRYYEALWHRLGASGAGDPAPGPPEFGDVTLRLPSLTRTAWDVAHVSNALALLPAERLAPFTRAYYLQGVLADDLSSPLNVVTQAEALAAPIDLADRRNVEARLHAIAVGRAAVRAQIALSDGTLQAYDAALADAGAVRSA